MHQRFSTQGLAPNHEFGYWRDVIGSTYFNLQLDFLQTERFEAQLDKWEMPTVSLSRLQSSALSYKRLGRHCQQLDRQILVTVPMQSEVEFTQLGRHMRCQPGQFLLEYSDEPYEFAHGQSNLLWVIKLPETALQARVGNASRYCAKEYDAAEGAGRLFRDYVQLMVGHCAHQGAAALSLMGTQMIDLLALALNEHADIGQGATTAVRGAHLARVEAHIRERLFDAELTPSSIAQSCGISLRYLHALFSDSGRSVAEAVRERRLRVAYEHLCSAGPHTSVAQIAYGVGFADQAQFSRLFRKTFGLSPSDVLKRGRGH